VYSQKLSADDKAHQAKADTIVNTVLKNVDTDGDENISPEELEKAGLNALPSFKELGAEGHHYDVESGTPVGSDLMIHCISADWSNPEFFLHHEGQYYATQLINYPMRYQICFRNLSQYSRDPDR